jgi:hypothetical protein
VYFTDGYYIRKITSDGQVSTVAGSSTPGYLDGTTANARFSGISSIVIDAAGNLYVCDAGYVVRRITPDGTVATVAGSTPGNVDGPGSSAQFDYLLGITMDAGGAIYLAQSDGPIRKIVIH